MKPNFKHDCSKCKYIGTTSGHNLEDWYYCTNGPGPTVICRYGDHGPGYSSYPVFLLEPTLHAVGIDDLKSYLEPHLAALGALTLARCKGLT